MVLQEAIDTIRKDTGLTLEATLLEGLDPDSVYNASQMPGYPPGVPFTLLHWSAYYAASDCTEVKYSMSFLDQRD